MYNIIQNNSGTAFFVKMQKKYFYKNVIIIILYINLLYTYFVYYVPFFKIEYIER